MDYKKHLNELRSKLATKKMSLMVGSGFSKNVSKKFPSWEELLFDLVYEMNKSEFDVEYLKQTKIPYRKLDKKTFLKAKCKDAILKRGYLDIVSDYLKNRSSEAITTYIEDRTPYIEYQGKELVLELGTKSEVLMSESLNLHRMILELPWNNVYTTNYDQLLDICIDEFQYQTMAREIEELEQDILNLNVQLDEYVKKIKTLGDDNHGDNFRDKSSSSSESLTPTAEDIHKEKERLKQERRQIEDSIDSKNEQITTKEQAQVNCFNVVRDASGLQLKRSSNIIKLHGSLRSKAQRKSFTFGFDRDYKKQYIISKEHYEQYPKDHEPFTQLMRISLLQESFCLIGFSGDDPNFLAWLGWVRDILQDDGLKNQKSYKIYLIDVNDDEVDYAKQLFYENYNIIRIPLMNPTVMDIIKGDRPIPFGSDRVRVSIQLFLAYLGDHKKINLIVPVSDLSIINEWRGIWSRLNFYTKDLFESEDLVRTSLEQLKNVSDKIFIPNLKDSYTQNQERLLNLFNPGNKRYIKREFDTNNLSLLLHAVKDSFLPITYVLDQVYISKLQNDLTTASQTNELIDLEESMILRLSPEQASDFQKVLSLAFSFRFDELIFHLRSWNAEPRQLMKKLGFLSFLSPSESEELLEDELRNHEQFSPEQRLHAYELLAFVKMTRYWSRDRKLDKMIASFKDSGFTSIEDNLRDLYKSMDEKPERPEPLGSGRYSTSDPQVFDPHPNTRYALKFLMLLIESGFQLNIRRAYRLSAGEWYKIIHLGFEYYPAAFLFYGLQINDKNYLKRLGQDYASSSKIPDFVLNDIALNLFNGMDSVHHEYSESICIFLSTMLIGVDVIIWEEKFLELWRKATSNSTAFEEKHQNEISPLIMFALRYIKNEKNILEILKDCLSSVLVKNKGIVVDYLYYLNRNAHYKAIKRNKFKEYVIDEVIDKVIVSLNLNTTRNLKVLGNIYALLSAEQIKKIRKQLSAIDLDSIGEGELWRIIIYFLKDDEKLVNIAQTKLLNSESLWFSGINGNTVSMGANPLELSRITVGAADFKGVVWADEEIAILYKKLKTVLPDLKRFAFKDDPWSSFEKLIGEMFWFMDFYRDKLILFADFDETHKIVYDLYHTNIVAYDSLEEGLMSDVKSEVNHALDELSDLFYKGNSHKDLIYLVVNRVLFQSSIVWEEALSYTSAWLSHQNGRLVFEGLTEPLLAILKKYKNQLIEDVEPSFRDEQLIKIAFAMHDLKHKDIIIDYWIKHANTSRFNNIKQLLFKRKNKDVRI